MRYRTVASVDDPVEDDKGTLTGGAIYDNKFSAYYIFVMLAGLWQKGVILSNIWDIAVASIPRPLQSQLSYLLNVAIQYQIYCSETQYA